MSKVYKTYDKAFKKARTMEWKTGVCESQGKSCWCRRVTTMKPIYYIDRDGDEQLFDFIGAGDVDKVTAKHVVKTHNFYVGEQKRYKKLNEAIVSAAKRRVNGN